MFGWKENLDDGKRKIEKPPKKEVEVFGFPLFGVWKGGCLEIFHLAPQKHILTN